MYHGNVSVRCGGPITCFKNTCIPVGIPDMPFKRGLTSHGIGKFLIGRLMNSTILSSLICFA